MKISGGTLKDRTIGIGKALLQNSDGCRLRPTPAKVREAVFNILRGVVEDSLFLDLYAGTGAVGFEALSRGAKRAVFVEENGGLIKTIKESVSRFGLGEKALVVRDDARTFLKKNEERFDIIFLDPPYACEETIEVVALIDRLETSGEGGIVIVEHSSKRELAKHAGALTLQKRYKYGDTSLSLYKKGEG